MGTGATGEAGAGRRLPRSVWVACRKAGGVVTRAAAGAAGAALVFALSMPVLDGPRPAARLARCESNLHQIGLATLMYAQDYDDRMPLRRNWSDGIYPYVKNWSVYVCPEAARQDVSPINTAARPGPPSYAFNSRLTGIRSARVKHTEAAPMLYDSSMLRWNAADPVWTFARRHNDGGIVAYLDGHVRWVAQLQPAGWNDNVRR
jgi:prepilin-type processing-associated H-X9-DG protein